MRKILWLFLALTAFSVGARAQTVHHFCPNDQNCTQTGSLTVNGNGNAGNVAIKAASADAIQYVSASGSDSNDGLSWGTAKASISSAIAALPTTTVGSSETPYGIVQIGAGSFPISSTISYSSQRLVIRGLGENITYLSCTVSGGDCINDTLHGNSEYRDVSGGLYDLTLLLNGQTNQVGVHTVNFADNFHMEHVAIAEQNTSSDGIGSIGWLAENDGYASSTQTERSVLDDVWFGWVDTGIKMEDTASSGTHDSFAHSHWSNVRWNLNNGQVAIEMDDDANIDDSMVTGTVNPNGTAAMVLFKQTGTGDTNPVTANIFVDGSGAGVTAISNVAGTTLIVNGSIGEYGSNACGGTCEISSQFGFSWNAEVTAQTLLYARSQLIVGGGGAVTSSGAGGTMAVVGPNGISAGTVTLSSGAASHTFASAYSTAPVCSATDTTAANAVWVTSVTTTGFTINGTSTDTVSWICTPASN